MTDNNTEQPVDPFEVAAESLLYGDPAEAKQRLRDAVLHGAAQVHAHQARQNLINKELASSHKVLNKFKEENPEWTNDPMISEAFKAGMRVEQLNDLIKAGLDLGKVAEATGRVPTETEIFNMHRDPRAVGNRDVRSSSQLFEDVASQVEGKFGIRRRVTNIDANRRRGITDRLKASAASHGTDLDGYATDWQPISRQPNLDAGEPATPETVQARDRRDAGEGGVDLTANRKAAFNKFFANRGGGVDRRPGAVRVDREASDRMYPDRRAAEG